MRPISAVLFDLDGTLVNSAPDLAFALNSVLQEQGHEPLSLEDIRPVAGHGSRGLLGLGFGITPEDDRYPPLQQRFLEIYQDNLSRETALFEGMEQVLNTIENANMIWGIITNKPSFLTQPVVDALGLSQRAACIVSGDTATHSKPHPAPMLYACDKINIPPEQCLYIGDAKRDIDAGKSVKMQTVAVRYGYLSKHDIIEDWHADQIIEHPHEILQWI